MEQEDQNTKGMLANIHHHFLHSAKTFRDLVCQGNAFSEGTFYRKLLSTTATLSPAERENIQEVAEYVLNRLTDCINQYKEHQ